MTDPNDQAFPRSYAYQNPMAGASELISVPGLTKREEFAKAAMQGILAHLEPGQTTYIYNLVAMEAVLFADALIEQLNQEKKQ